MRRIDEVVPLWEAALPLSQLADGSRLDGPRTRSCLECGETFDVRSAPPGYPAFCTQVCVGAYRRARP